jgi:hypothetical protein
MKGPLLEHLNGAEVDLKSNCEKDEKSAELYFEINKL